MDRLARNAMLARQAGMSYGKWKAMQTPVVIIKKPEGLVCKYCGKTFPKNKYRARAYCSDYCKYNAKVERTKKKEQGNG